MSNIEISQNIRKLTVAAKYDLVSLKTEVDKTDVGRLKIVAVDLSKLSNVVKMKLSDKLCMIN